MMKRYIITLTASNRVGVLAAVATALAELGGELLEVKQTLLHQFFTMIIAAEFPAHRDRQVIVDHLRGVCGPFGIEVSLKDPESEILPAPEAGEYERHWLTLRGKDKPGLLSRIATRLAREGIDVLEMYATRTDEGRGFQMLLELAVPAEIGVAELPTALEELGSDVGVTAQIEEPGSSPVSHHIAMRSRI